MTDVQSTANSKAWRNSPEFAEFQRKAGAQSARIADKNTADKFLASSGRKLTAYAQGREVVFN